MSGSMVRGSTHHTERVPAGRPAGHRPRSCPDPPGRLRRQGTDCDGRRNHRGGMRDGATLSLMRARHALMLAVVSLSVVCACRRAAGTTPTGLAGQRAAAPEPPPAQPIEPEPAPAPPAEEIPEPVDHEGNEEL